MRFSVHVSESSAQHYLDGIPIGDDEAEEAWRIYGEPECDEE